jgi:diguanylate cyclase (GGDEF)-like protein/putative nucleotidyltransferase with HDIG domain
VTTQALPALAKLALGATQNTPAQDVLIRAMTLVRGQTGAVGALLFFGEEGVYAGAGVGDEPERYPASALTYLQQRLVQLRVPLAFNLAEGEISHMTRAANKQRRDYVAWLVPAADSWTEMLILRGSWPPIAIEPLLEFVDSALPALTIMLERFVGVGRKHRLEKQISTISDNVDVLGRAAELIGSVAAVSTLHELPQEQAVLLRTLAEESTRALEEVRANRDLMESHLRLQEYTSRLERMVQAERQQASTDALTGLMNHRGALQALQSSFDASHSSGSPFSLLMGDIDGFKLFNDTYGHVLGDDVLKLVSDVTRKVADPMNGIACRYGGDEFLIVLPGLDKASATAVANEITERLGRAEFRSDENSIVPVSMSLGVASYPEDGDTASKIVAAADAAMYAAKRRAEGGRSSSVTTTEDTTFGVLDSLVQAIDVKDSYTKVHCDIVAEYAVKLAVRLNLPEESQRALRIAGLLHDIGKLAVPDEILKKPAPLNAEEYKIMQRHVTIGEVLIREVPQLKEVIQAVACHHERYDGSGYPRGLKGEQIPLIGRIIAIADSYSAMCLDRPYRKGMSHDRVLAEMVAGAGIQFDPGLTEIFVQLLLEEQLERGRAAA